MTQEGERRSRLNQKIQKANIPNIRGKEKKKVRTERSKTVHVGKQNFDELFD